MGLTIGMVPYVGVNGKLLLERLLNGVRLEKPSETPTEM